MKSGGFSIHDLRHTSEHIIAFACLLFVNRENEKIKFEMKQK